jgi:hypothetical protein
MILFDNWPTRWHLCYHETVEAHPLAGSVSGQRMLEPGQGNESRATSGWQ